MRFFKYFMAFAIPFMIVFIIWRQLKLGDNYTYYGIGNMIDYVSTYHGFDYTYQLFKSLGDSWAKINTEGVDVWSAVIATFNLLFAPISLLFTLTMDVVNNIIFFFGWIDEITV